MGEAGTLHLMRRSGSKLFCELWSAASRRLETKAGKHPSHSCVRGLLAGFPNLQALDNTTIWPTSKGRCLMDDVMSED